MLGRYASVLAGYPFQGLPAGACEVADDSGVHAVAGARKATRRHATWPGATTGAKSFQILRLFDERASLGGGWLPLPGSPPYIFLDPW